MPISLEKRTEAAEGSLISLLKKEQAKGNDLGDLVAQVEMAIDYSGSMGGLYPDTVQDAVERALALSLSGLDDDGVVPVHFFHDSDFPPESVDANSYQGFVANWAANHRMGGTSYGPTISNILGGQGLAAAAKKGLFKKKSAPAAATSVDLEQEKVDPPKLVLFFTDGAPSDGSRAEQLLVQARTRPIFWQFVLLGTDLGGERYLDHLNNNLSGPGVDNVGVCKWPNPAGMTDEAAFDDIVSEFFPKWLPAARAAGITKC